MGTTDRMSAKIHVDHLVDAMSKNCPHLERLEFRFVLTYILKGDKVWVAQILEPKSPALL